MVRAPAQREHQQQRDMDDVDPDEQLESEPRVTGCREHRVRNPGGSLAQAVQREHDDDEHRRRAGDRRQRGAAERSDDDGIGDSQHLVADRRGEGRDGETRQRSADIPVVQAHAARATFTKGSRCWLDRRSFSSR
jgi:hypothetical protein